MSDRDLDQLRNRSIGNALALPKLDQIHRGSESKPMDWKWLKTAKQGSLEEGVETVDEKPSPYMACHTVHNSTFSPLEGETKTLEYAEAGINCPKGAENATYRIDQYKNDSVVVRKGLKPSRAFLEAPRGEIGAAPSAASLQRLIFLLNNCEPQVNTMLTLTISPECEASGSVSLHKAAKNAACQRLRRLGYPHFVWVREFTQKGLVHWHIFLHDPNAKQVTDKAKAKDFTACSDWSRWWARYYEKKHCDVGKMASASCCWEVLVSSAAGRYAAKEGAKRFQKEAPEHWAKGGGAWWRASRGFEVELESSGFAKGEELEWAFVEKPNGQLLGVPKKYQRFRKLLGA